MIKLLPCNDIITQLLLDQPHHTSKPVHAKVYLSLCHCLYENFINHRGNQHLTSMWSCSIPR